MIVESGVDFIMIVESGLEDFIIRCESGVEEVIITSELKSTVIFNG